MAKDVTLALISALISVRKQRDPNFRQLALARRLGISDTALSRQLRGIDRMSGLVFDELVDLLDIRQLADQLEAKTHDMQLENCRVHPA